MASAVDSRLAYARLSAVATASRLPTATRGSNNSYTTSWDTTIKLSIGEQTGVSSDLGLVELKLESTVKIDPKAPLFRFTHRVCHIR